ncbi:MAG: TMEM165/GDT1 family protein [Bacillota bacterium]|jgi:putative Ca2+/H+ antiporter (TMEM165/GDT1 family)
MEAFLTTFALIFAMEMGDKSQLIIVALACRYTWRQVLGGLTLAAVVTHGLAVALGQVLGSLIPFGYVKTVAALAFLGFAFHCLRPETEEDDEDVEPSRLATRWPVFAIALTFFISELGDKTQLAVVAAVVENARPWATWAGAVGGMIIADSLAIAVGQLLQRVPGWVMRGLSVTLFLFFGWSTLVEAWGWVPMVRYLGAALLILYAGLVIWRQELERVRSAPALRPEK